MALLLDMLTTAAMLFVVTAGLMMIFGVMKIVNFAHGALLTLGGYASYVTTRLQLDPWLGWPLALVAGIHGQLRHVAGIDEIGHAARHADEALAVPGSGDEVAVLDHGLHAGAVVQWAALSQRGAGEDIDELLHRDAVVGEIDDRHARTRW